MKWVKVAIGAVIAISVIPIIAIAVNNLDTPKLKTVEFEVVAIDDLSITVTDNTFNNLLLYSIVDDETVTNLLSVELNDLEQTQYVLRLGSSGRFDYNDYNANDWGELDDTNTLTSQGYSATIGDKWTMTFEVSIIPLRVKLLVGFVPLIFVAGVVSYLFVKTKKEE